MRVSTHSSPSGPDKAVGVHQILPDRHTVAALREPASIVSRYGSQALDDGLRPGCGCANRTAPANSAPKSATSLSAALPVHAPATLPGGRKASTTGPRGTGRPFRAAPSGTLDRQQRPSRSAEGGDLLFVFLAEVVTHI